MDYFNVNSVEGAYLVSINGPMLEKEAYVGGNGLRNLRLAAMMSLCLPAIGFLQARTICEYRVAEGFDGLSGAVFHLPDRHGIQYIWLRPGILNGCKRLLLSTETCIPAEAQECGVVAPNRSVREVSWKLAPGQETASSGRWSLGSRGLCQ